MSSESTSAHQRSPSPRALRLPEGRRTRDRSPSPMRSYLIPSPLPTRRNRTFSATTRAAEGPTYSGVCKCFCRSKGHGFITPGDGAPEIFVHISDIEGEYVPVAGDEVTYKVCTIPPKNEKLQAVEVNITHLAPGTKHETWSGTRGQLLEGVLKAMLTEEDYWIVFNNLRVARPDDFSADCVIENRVPKWPD